MLKPVPGRRPTAAAAAALLLALAALALGLLAAPPAPPAAAPLPGVTPTAAPVVISPLPAAVPTAVPPSLPVDPFAPPGAADIALYDTLLGLPIPPYDREAAALALGRVSSPGPGAGGPPARADSVLLGDSGRFWVHNLDEGAFREVEARLVAVSEYAYFWLDEETFPATSRGTGALTADWEVAASTFDATVEAVTAVFGPVDWTGVDGERRLHVLHSDAIGMLGGYFSGADAFPREIMPRSNQRKLFVMSVRWSGGIGSDYYHATLAHELQHMIHHGLDPYEDLWINEGLSKLAQQVAGLRGDENVADFMFHTDRSLWFFNNELQDYGHAYLVMAYLYERFGPEFIGALVANPAVGMAGIDATLAALGHNTTFDALYGDFMAALLLDDPALGDGRYTIASAAPGRLRSSEVIDRLPAMISGEVHQYGIDVIRVRGEEPVEILFNGAQTVHLIPAEPEDGGWMWWSNRREMMHSTLTRQVDLRDVESAVLTFRAWYDMERDWDYAYVLASTDGGETWTPLASTSSRSDDPNGQNYGQGITGRSGRGGPSAWVTETVDLSDYAGQVILLRFALITDAGVTRPGLALREISIPAIGFRDDAASDAGWQADGFIRMHNRVPQRWLVQAVLIRWADADRRVPGEVQIETLSVVGGAALLNTDLSDVDELVLLISGQTRFTTETAPYHITVVPR